LVPRAANGIGARTAFVREFNTGLGAQQTTHDQEHSVVMIVHFIYCPFALSIYHAAGMARIGALPFHARGRTPYANEPFGQFS
jgi:hypothetical protein